MWVNCTPTSSHYVLLQRGPKSIRQTDTKALNMPFYHSTSDRETPDIDNTLCPGPINTNRLSYWERARAEEQGMPLEELRAQIVAELGRATPIGRIAEPEDVANMVVFLASDEASFITGQGYNVNGGLFFH
jgi:NAD(P)-dependent dehydrogenase (short-subunit alcohol dehydrogenase family)